MRVLAYGETGFRNFTNSKLPIKSPADMKGLKIRVMETPVYVNMVKALGAAPTPIAWSEVYTALQQKVVDGQENPVATIVQAKLYEVQKYMILDGHSYGVDFFLINDKFYQSLPKETQELHQDLSLYVSSGWPRYSNPQFRHRGLRFVRQRVCRSMRLLQRNGLSSRQLPRNRLGTMLRVRLVRSGSIS